jgi:hypothetical protein
MLYFLMLGIKRLEAGRNTWQAPPSRLLTCLQTHRQGADGSDWRPEQTHGAYCPTVRQATSRRQASKQGTDAAGRAGFIFPSHGTGPRTLPGGFDIEVAGSVVITLGSRLASPHR